MRHRSAGKHLNLTISCVHLFLVVNQFVSTIIKSDLSRLISYRVSSSNCCEELSSPRPHLIIGGTVQYIQKHILDEYIAKYVSILHVGRIVPQNISIKE